MIFVDRFAVEKRLDGLARVIVAIAFVRVEFKVMPVLAHIEVEPFGIVPIFRGSASSAGMERREMGAAVAAL